MNIEQFESPMPGMIPSASSGAVSSSKYRVRCLKADISDFEGVTQLEDILTRGLDGKDIVIVEKATHAFNESYWVIVTYLEKRNAS
jgi:hypothetical protein